MAAQSDHISKWHHCNIRWLLMCWRLKTSRSSSGPDYLGRFGWEVPAGSRAWGRLLRFSSRFCGPFFFFKAWTKIYIHIGYSLKIRPITSDEYIRQLGWFGDKKRQSWDGWDMCGGAAVGIGHWAVYLIKWPVSACVSVSPLDSCFCCSFSGIPLTVSLWSC